MRAPVNDLPVVFDRVSLRAGSTAILDRVSATIEPGAPTLVVGPNGAGKSTLAAAVHGFGRRRPKAASHGAAARMQNRHGAHSCFSGR